MGRKTTVWICLTVAVLCGSAAAQRGSRKSLRVAVYSCDPFIFLNEDGNPEGLYPDLLDEIFHDHSKWRLEYVPVAWSQGLQQLQAGDLDLVLAVAFTPERARSMDYNTEAVAEVWGQVFVPDGMQLSSVSELENRRVGVMQNDVNSHHFKLLCEALQLSCTMLEYPALPAIFKAVEAGELDAGVAPHHFGRSTADDYRLQGTPVQFSPFNVYFAAKKGHHAEVLNEIDRHLIAWKNDPDSFYYERLDHWLSGEYNWTDRVPVWFWYLLGSVLFSTGLLIILNRMLRRRINRQTAALRESEERLALAVSAGGIGIWDRDIIHDTLIWDDRMLEIYGLDRASFEGRYESWTACLHPDDQDAVILAVAKTEQDDIPLNREFRIIRPDGEVRHVRAHGRAIRDPSGRIARLIGTNQDITEQQQADEQIRLQADVLDQIQDLVLITDLDGIITYANQAENELFPPGDNGLVGQSICSLADDPAGWKAQETILRETKAKGRWRGRVENRLPGGRHITLDCRTQMLKDKNGDAFALCGISTDITQQMQMEQELLARNEELERFNKLATGREMRMMELKHEINVLSRLCGKPEPYSMTTDSAGDTRGPS